MNVVSLALGILSTILGAIAALRWYKAAAAAKAVPLEQTEALRRFLRRLGRLNKQAAYWTAGTVFVTGLTALLSSLH